jgi:hypothetical protein
LLVGETTANTLYFAIGFEKFRLVIKGIHVRNTAIGKDKDHSLGFGWKVWLFWREWI